MIDMDRLEWTIYGVIGAGLYLGVRLSRGEKLNKWLVITTFVAGPAVSGTCTEVLVKSANLPPFWAGFLALLAGISAMGIVVQVADRKFPLVNKLIGGDRDDSSSQG